MSTDTVFSVGSEDCRFVCCILPTAFVTVLSWVERKWNVSVIRRVFLPRHVDKKGRQGDKKVSDEESGTDSDSDSE